MDNAIYIALSSQDASFRQLEVVANNIANANTTGYKSEKILFEQFIVKGGKVGDKNEEISYQGDLKTYRDTSQGAFFTTGSPLDVAIQGDGFFPVSTPQGEKYTRAGGFTRNSAGEIVTSHGHKVLNKSGQPIIISEGTTQITIREDGMVEGTLDGSQEELGIIGVVTFDDPRSLTPFGEGLYDGGNPIPASIDDYRIIQGTLEQSNVNTIDAITQLIDVSRSTNKTAEMMSELHDLLRTTYEVISSQN